MSRRSLWLCLAFLIATLLPPAALAQGQTQTPSPAPPALAQPASHVTEYTLPADKLAESLDLYRIGMVKSLCEFCYGLAILLLLCSTKAGASLRNLAEKVSRRCIVQAIIVVPPLLFILSLLNLPFDLFGQWVELHYSLSVQSWGSWFWDWTKSGLIALPLMTLLAYGFYVLARHFPKRLWFWCWMASAPLMIFMVFLSPILIEPLFNKFEPLENTHPQLVEQIERLSARAGVHIPRDRIYLMKASEKVSTDNAYVSGLGSSKRIVVWDNTANKLSTDETAFIVGHEMGHYVLHHLPMGIAFVLLLSFSGYWLWWHMTKWLIARNGERWGIRAIDDWASLPLLLLVLSLLSFASSPIFNAYSRHIEHQADTYGLEVTHGLTANSSQTAADSFQRMGEKALVYPHPNRLYVLWYYSHPPIADRVDFALHYHPWNEGQLMRFIK